MTDLSRTDPSRTDRSSADPTAGVSGASEPATNEPTAAAPATTVYWRPGCGFCTRLLRDLDELGLPHERVNIYETHEGAAFVRSVADGNETVPTVRVGDVALVNPTRDDVVLEVAAVAPDQMPDGWEPTPPGRVARTLRRLLGA